MGRGLGPLQQRILGVLAQIEADKRFPVTTRDVAESLDAAWWGDPTRVRAVRRALDALWRRGLIDKFVLTGSGDPDYQAGWSSWRVHDAARPPEPEGMTVDPYGRYS